MINILQKIFTTKTSAEYDFIIAEVVKLYKFAPVDFGGGCSLQKALTMAAFIKELKLQDSADIGVYRGRSLFPQAVAHKNYTKGIVYGIDPYDKIAAVQNDRPGIKEMLDNFAETTDFNQIYKEVSELIKNYELESHCKLIRMKSRDAKKYFIENEMQLGLVHIDGNHDTSFVFQDVDDYLPLMKDGGVIVLDDISWDSVKPALDVLNEKCKFIGNIIDNQNDFAVFIRNSTIEQYGFAKKIFKHIKNHKYNLV